MKFTDAEYIKNTLFKRNRDAHKGNFGKVLIFAGSAGMAGAAVLCGRTALRTGAGLVKFLIPWRPSETPVMDFCSVMQTAVPEATCVEYNRRTNFNDYSAIAAGPGLGQGKVSASILLKILKTYSGVLVLDADALNIIAKKDWDEYVRSCKAEIIITPHIGEAKRLLRYNGRIKTPKERLDAALDLTDMFEGVTVLKGAGTLVAAKRISDSENTDNSASEKEPDDIKNITAAEDDDFEIYENTTGNPGMAVGGSGDVLTGVIVSLAAQGYAPIDAARIGVFIHGLAGDICAKEIGEMGMISSDICAALPRALKSFYENL